MVMETIQCIRKNHALEHATIAVLIEKGYQTPLVGLSTPYGFFIFGKLTKEDIAKAIKIALGRLDNGLVGIHQLSKALQFKMQPCLPACRP